ncbi:LOW QUALITY PROTEIN: attractin-like protein 1 [Tachypleus tridentatus]|uniref:LOW QUALITY PROTEIN: attractin-like protein 1 n=1 Tax=Tachypleus tridentatus TaxID=6853 RepID=UPI003FD5E62A
MENGLPMYYDSQTVAKRSKKILRISNSVKLKLFIILLMIQIFVEQTFATNRGSCEGEKNDCLHGICRSGECVCDRGWKGASCHFCGGRDVLTSPSGIISDGVGNYSLDTQCAWLIDSGEKNATVHLKLVNFETQCSRDHLYIFDGDSIFSPLVAAFSGHYRIGESPLHQQEVVTHSGSAFLFFFSDSLYNMSGFTLFYRINGCPLNCSEHGVCVDNQCTCWAGWAGKDCSYPVCPGNCNNGTCDRENHHCVCDSEFRGPDCSMSTSVGGWEVVTGEGIIVPRALHQSLMYDDVLWVFGGESFNQEVFLNVAKFNFSSKSWENFDYVGTESTRCLHGHSVITYKEHIYLFGGKEKNGVVVKIFWSFDFKNWSWKEVLDYNAEKDCLTDLCSPVAVVGHTANMVGDRMIVIFGYNPVFGYLNIVQEYSFLWNSWKTVQTNGAIVKGGYGHTSVYDEATQFIYVHGGYHSQGEWGEVVDVLYAYHPFHQSWTILSPSGSYRYLHGAAVLQGMLLIYGGSTHNDSVFDAGDKCYSADFLAYDIGCDTWHVLKSQAAFVPDPERFGHTAVTYDGSMYVFGGFNGQLLSSLLKFTPGSCEIHESSEDCEMSLPGRKCWWNFNKKTCEPVFHTLTHKSSHLSCQRRNINFTSLCEKLTSCPSCLANTYDCVWCGSLCSYKRCSKSQKKTISLEACEDTERSNCDKLHVCHACHTEYHCGWEAKRRSCTFVREISNKTEKAFMSNDLRVTCEPPCSNRSTCEYCIEGNCVWCGNQKQCLEKNALTAMFPTAQCMEVVANIQKCVGLECKDIQHVGNCQENPRCGWCDDGSGTGRGACKEGGYTGPVTWNGLSYSVNTSICSEERWFFTSIPECQCNGHSTCINGTVVCKQPCQHLTEGKHCERCIDGYYGNPVNGGNCTQCFCNGHGEMCHHRTGNCYCTTKGIIGHNCSSCDEIKHYLGNPEDGGTCFYNLDIGFKYTFDMTKSEDKFYNRINLLNVPKETDIDVEFSITCSGPALVNVSVASALLPEQPLLVFHECNKTKLHFAHKQHYFGAKNTTFFVYVFNFKTPIIIEISFSQHKSLDLLQFFITFSSCFLTLLVIAAVLWKVKQKYDLYRRRQQLFVEMEQMASRPFAGVLLSVDNFDMSEISENADSSYPAPVALEPCLGGKAAVLSLIVKLPTNNKNYTPQGQCGIAIASALVSLGNLKKTTTAVTTTPVIKEEGKVELWKTHNQSGTYI